MLRRSFGGFGLPGHLFFRVAVVEQREPPFLPKDRPSVWHAETGVPIRAARLAAGYTQQAIAAKLNCTFQAYQKIERGTTQVHAHTIIKLSRLFGVDMKDLLSPSDEDFFN